MNVIIGDVHGCLLTLTKLVNKIKGNIIYSVGDIVDKGPDSAACLDFCKKENIKVIKGNHEELYLIHMEKYLNGENIINTDWYKYWGGDRTVKSYDIYSSKQKNQKIKEHINYIKSLPYYYFLKEVDGKKGFISHGFGLPYIYSKTRRGLISNRLNGKYIEWEKIQEDLKEIGYINIFGHDAFKEVQKNELFYGIDTGCVYGKQKGNKLSAIIWETKEIISEKLIDKVDYIE